MKTHIHVRGFGTAAIITLVAILAVGSVILATDNKNTDSSLATPTHEGAMMVDEKKMTDDTGDVTMKDKVMVDDTQTDDMKKDGEQMMDATQGTMKEKETMLDKEDAIVESDIMDKKMMDDTTYTNATMKNEEKMAGTYDTYTPEKIAQADTQDTVLFFHAPWCPSCRTLDAAISKNTENIPEGVQILKVDYDQHTDLRKKYGVTTQHTMVQVDKDGNKVAMWSGGSSLNAVLSKIQ